MPTSWSLPLYQAFMATRPAFTTGSAARPSRRTRALAVLGAATAALAVGVVAESLAGIDLTVRMGAGASVHRIGPIAVVLATVLAGLAGWALLAAQERLTPRARSAWTLVALVVLVLSLAGPLGGGTTTAARASLACRHLAAAVVLIPMPARSVVRR
jgi:Family of unknown function (DUF6069)